MSKIKLNNYYDNLTPKQKIEIEDKKGIILYYNYLDECQEFLNYEQIGILTMALVFYGRTKGREPLPEELQDKIEEDNLLCYFCGNWLNRIAEADKNWLSHKRSKKERKHIQIKDDVYEMVGNINNMPDDELALKIKSDEDVDDFITYGNNLEWVLPFEQLLALWRKNGK